MLASRGMPAGQAGPTTWWLSAGPLGLYWGLKLFPVQSAARANNHLIVSPSLSPVHPGWETSGSSLRPWLSEEGGQSADWQNSVPDSSGQGTMCRGWEAPGDGGGRGGEQRASLAGELKPCWKSLIWRPNCGTWGAESSQLPGFPYPILQLGSSAACPLFKGLGWNKLEIKKKFLDVRLTALPPLAPSSPSRDQTGVLGPEPGAAASWSHWGMGVSEILGLSHSRCVDYIQHIFCDSFAILSCHIGFNVKPSYYLWHN